MLLPPRSFRMKVNGSFYPPSSSGVGTLPTRLDKPFPRRTLRSDTPKQFGANLPDAPLAWRLIYHFEILAASAAHMGAGIRCPLAAKRIRRAGNASPPPPNPEPRPGASGLGRRRPAT